MRCLFCNKKLSLLKLAKGDSYCSPEHFDAHQLKQSQDAFQRLMSLPEEAPKAPLVVKPKEETPPEPPAAAPPKPAQLKSAQTRRELPPPAAAPLPLAPITPASADASEESAAFARLRGSAPREPARREIQPPPYAPFARSPLPIFSPKPQGITAPPEAAQAVDAVHEVSFPVHEVAATICILNLYLRLILAGTEPKNWSPDRHLVVTPEDFNLLIHKPPLGLMLDCTHLEKLAPAETAPPMEAVAPEEPPAPIPEASTPVLRMVMPSEPLTITPMEPLEPRLPFLIAPSFRERKGPAIALDSAPTSVPTGTALSPILDRNREQRVDTCSAIPQITRFARNPKLRVLDEKNWISSGPSLKVIPAFLRPGAKKQVCPTAWQPSSIAKKIARPALKTKWIPLHPMDVDFPAPASLVVRPDAIKLASINPERLLNGSTFDPKALFLNVLETRLQGGEAHFVGAVPDAMESGWRTRLAAFPAEQPLPAAWQARTAHFLPATHIEPGSISPLPSVHAQLYSPACNKIERLESVVLPELFVADASYRPTAWPGKDSACTPLTAKPGVIFTASTLRPQVADRPSVSFQANGDTPVLPWEPRLPSVALARAVKFLPARSRAILPEAAKWERLESVPR